MALDSGDCTGKVGLACPLPQCRVGGCGRRKRAESTKEEKIKDEGKRGKEREKKGETGEETGGNLVRGGKETRGNRHARRWRQRWGKGW